MKLKPWNPDHRETQEERDLMAQAANSVKLVVGVDLDDLVDDLAALDRESLVEFVKRLDERVADWDFTMELVEHFEELHAEHDAEAESLDR